jgi:hypothetical protein
VVRLKIPPHHRIRNPKLETRDPKEIRSPNPELVDWRERLPASFPSGGEPKMGGTGDSPVPVGDSPTGTEKRVATFKP